MHRNLCYFVLVVLFLNIVVYAANDESVWAAPVTLLPMQNVTAVAAGSNHTCALTSSGGVKCWGNNQAGQLGDGTTTMRVSPVTVVGLSSGVRALAGGSFHTCALMDNGGVKCWGQNSLGQLGDGSTTTRLVPVDVVGLNSGVSAIAVGDQHSCATMSSGSVQCWGRNHRGQLGDGTTADRITPLAVLDLSSVVSTLTAGTTHTCAALSGGGVKCWGSNTVGQLGDGTSVSHLRPVDVLDLSAEALALAAGSDYTCALLNGGSLKCWGGNTYGQLGDGSENARLTPGDVTGLTSGVSAITAGYQHTCAALSSGGARCTGFNTSGQLGDDSLIRRSTPVTVVGLDGIVLTALAGGHGHTCAVTSGGGVKCWGANSDGQLGDGMTAPYRTAPIDVLEERYTLTIHVMGDGAVTISPDQVTYAANDAITLMAAPAGGLTFAGWRGDLAGSTNPITFPIGGDKIITATFTLETAPTLTPTPTMPVSATPSATPMATNTPPSAGQFFLPLVSR